MTRTFGVRWLWLLLLGGCGSGTPAAPGGRVALEVSALNLVGVGDVVWDIEVVNGAGASVWQRRLSSSGYGDGAGSASYVGPCDADPSVAQNTVKVWVVGVYGAAVGDEGVFSSGSDAGPGAVDGAAHVL